MATVNQRLYNNSVRHQIGILRYSSGVVKTLVGIFNRATYTMLNSISAHDPSLGGGSFSASRLAALLDHIKAQTEAMGKEIADSLDKSVRDLAEHEVSHTIDAIDKAFPVDVVRGIKGDDDLETKKASFGLLLGVPTAEQVYAAISSRPFEGRIMDEYYKDLPASIFDRLKATISQGFTNGQTTDQIIRSLRGTRAANFTDGLLQQSRRSIERTTRTALNHTATVAREQVYKKNDDLISGVRWVSTLDMRTSDVCQALDGEVFPPDEGPRPPAHFNCRSTTTPITKSWRELGFDIDELPPGTRASMDGQVPDTETYSSWLGRQSAEVQNDVLGPTRAELFREGGLTLDRFVDDAGNTLTIDQLRIREADAFAKVDGTFPFAASAVDDLKRTIDDIKVTKTTPAFSAAFVKSINELPKGFMDPLFKDGVKIQLFKSEALAPFEFRIGALALFNKREGLMFFQDVIKLKHLKSLLAHEVAHRHDAAFLITQNATYRELSRKVAKEWFTIAARNRQLDYYVSLDESWAAAAEMIFAPGARSGLNPLKALFEKHGLLDYAKDWYKEKGML